MGYNYDDPRVARQWWGIHGVEIEAKWLAAILPRLREGEAITSELAALAGIKPGTEYGRFLMMLRKHQQAGRIEKIGQRKGALHVNNIWRLRDVSQ